MPSVDDISLLVEEVYQKARVSADAKAQANLDAEAARNAAATSANSHNEWAAAHAALADAVTVVNKALAALVEEDKAGTSVVTLKKPTPPPTPAKPALKPR